MGDKVTIRRATLDDYQDVMNIGQIYQGRDYLPVKYVKYLQWFDCYVAEIDGSIVAFNAARLVDEGQTITSSASRVKESYQGQGILAAILKVIHTSFRSIESVKYEAITTGNLNFDVNGDKLIKNKFHRILEQVFVEYVVEVKDFKPEEMVDASNTKLVELTEEDFKRVFNSKEMCKELFPENRLVINWHPFRLLPGNIIHVMELVNFMSLGKQSTYKTLSVTDNYYFDGEILVYKLELLGYDSNEMQQHVVCHLHNISRLANRGNCKTIMVHLAYIEDCSNPELFLSVFYKCGFKKGDFLTNQVVLLEREL